MTYEISLSRIKDLPDHRRPREMARLAGVNRVSEEMLLAIVLRAGIRGQSVIDLARRLLDRYQGSLARLAEAPPEELQAIPGVGPVKALELCAAFELGRRARPETADARPPIREPAQALAVLEPLVATLDQETVWVLPLDSKYRLQRAPREVTRGILDASLSHPREIFREAIRLAAAAIIIAHNHPSGDPTPSAEDVTVTRQLVETGRLVGIQVLDHLIIGGHRPSPAPYISLRESGIVDFS